MNVVISLKLAYLLLTIGFMSVGGFFTFVTVFGCLLLLVQLGLVPVNGAGQIVLTPEAMRRARRLMTLDEVARLKPGGDLYGKLATNADEETQRTMGTPSSSMEEGRDETGAAPSQTGLSPNADIADAEVVVHSHVDDEEENTCAVCLDELVTQVHGAESDNLTLCLPCNHHFHSECIVPWLTERQGTCPLCKFDVLQYIMDVDDKQSTGSVKRYWLKQLSRRLSPLGWSPVSLEGSDSESQGETSTVEHDSDNSTSGNNPSSAAPSI